MRGMLSENPWLFTWDAKNGYRFGAHLAAADAKTKLLPTLLVEQRKSEDKNASVFFLSGYLQVLQKQDAKKSHELLDSMEDDAYFLPHLLELVWRTELDEHTGELVLKLLEGNKIDYKEVARFKMGAAVRNISDELFDKWITHLLNRSDVNAHATAVDLFLSHYVFQQKKQLPKALSICASAPTSHFQQIQT